MPTERKNQLWIPLYEVKRFVKGLNPKDKSQLPALFAELEQLAKKRGFPWSNFLKTIEEIVVDVYNPYIKNVKNPTLTLRAKMAQSKIEYLVECYHDEPPEDREIDPHKIASAVTTTIESLLEKNYFDLNPIQRLILLSDLKRYGFNLQPADLIKSPEAP